MSSNGFVSTLDLRLAPSHRALRVLYLVHLVPLGLLAFAMPPGMPMLAIAAAFALSWGWLRRHPAFGFGPRALTQLIWQPGSGWRLRDAAGREQAARLQGDSYVTSRLIVLNFRGEDGRRRSRALLGDELPPDALRRLRARLMTGLAGMPDASGADRAP